MADILQMIFHGKLLYFDSNFKFVPKIPTDIMWALVLVMVWSQPTMLFSHVWICHWASGSQSKVLVDFISYLQAHWSINKIKELQGKQVELCEASIVAADHCSDVIMSAIVYSTICSRHRSKKTSKLHVTGLCVGNSSVTCEFPTPMASNTENVSIWWRHHGHSTYRWLSGRLQFQSREYWIMRNRYWRLLFTCEDRLCTNLHVQEQLINMTSQCQYITLTCCHRSAVVTSQC